MMFQTQPFNALTIPIERTNLIEASAGTGKTYGIAALFTRLIVLEKMAVERILVVTFTKAATAELKTRLRARLEDALEVLETLTPGIELIRHDTDYQALHTLYRQYRRQEEAPDDFIFKLLAEALKKENLPRLVIRLKAAIADFDSAAIFTIHGFCQRLLRDYAFLCQVPFDTELTEQNDERLLLPAQDFWRTRIANNPTLARLVYEHKYTPQNMLASLRRFLNRPHLNFRRPNADLDKIEAELHTCWQDVRNRLPELIRIFWNVRPTLNGNSYRESTFKELFAELQYAADNGLIPGDSKGKLADLDAEILQSKLKKGQTANHEAFKQLHILAELGRLKTAHEEAATAVLTALQIDMLVYLNQAQAEYKKSNRERDFDDLLIDVHNALNESPLGHTFAKTVAENWQVALIDEFQDTDPLQYGIFRDIFIRHGNPLFLVGDPKQAIYSFRGADIYAYLQAAKDAEYHYTLDINYRSHTALVDGISALFNQKQRPFVLEDLDFAEVRAQRNESRLDPPQNVIRIRWLHGNETEAVSKEVLRRRAADYCADEIAGILNQAETGRLNFQGEPLQSGHIAVLVRTHNEGHMIAGALKARNVQSVLIYHDSVFAAEEAAALAALISFWLQPQRTELLRFVLSSVLFGFTAADLHTLNQSEAELSEWIHSAETAAQQWQQHGFYAAMQAFSSRHGIETHLLASGNERSLTNYHQLLEKLAEEDEQSHTPAALLQWLQAQIQSAHSGKSAKSNILRLESDEALVKIVTIHASKGLEYPLVFCPFIWDAAKNTPDDWQVLHTPSGGTELLAKHQLDSSNEQQLADETASENLRLLYVALTRAAEQLTIYAGYCNNTPDNTFAYLLEGTPQTSREDTAAAYMAERKSNKAAGEMQMFYRNWQSFVQKHPDSGIALCNDIPPPAVYHANNSTQGNYQAHILPERIFEFIRHTSFTGLSRTTPAHDYEYSELQPTLDPAEAGLSNLPVSGTDTAEADSIFDFPRGAAAGICLHELLEKFNFNLSAVEQTELIRTTLAKHSFDAEYWYSSIASMLEHTRRTQLTGKYALADIPTKQRLPEMGFVLHMEDFKLPHIRTWLAQDHIRLPQVCIDAAALLDFSDVKGFLNGFIDMVYQDSDGHVCIIDYKSNHLGNSSNDYSAENMDTAMAEHHYYLQALIYAIATARYFKQRGRPLQTVAVRYLFLRGLNNNGNGVWSWDIDTADLAPWL
ncbi:exodeoxyribonuclease V subunit beta [Neisseria arctica]|uniref:RecBCD enzyme subunit RecB n=1 Tax=Neisseria arctica TaxID=1470200 RepID=A0A0J0YRM6_9NEIS|nr:exodeoxyribonuclease V subunit beta [Neisseria arctica]KLT72770.1 exodeoxyribonuclease V subunit beta [Neisseria arctica]UOO87268.1 exodeoxyribonuclease V subunit beta [Neisseria arctica]